MALRFNWRIRMLPGLWLNLSKGGVSTSIRGRGAWLRFGKLGVRTTVGVPGTELWYTSTRGKPSHGAPQAHSEQAAPPGDAVRGRVWLALILAVIVFAIGGHAWPTAQSSATCGADGCGRQMTAP